ncbi:hypothetical protein EXN66_Car022424 [Channa argus]|uniref:Uncharacterized protein n=1 Tax=Channa argus TaxID=215402 RepID=A0A6G1QVU0_CHAAH|nr:hypothetical protein EXN66_Car022424 [Channa argus]
MDITPKKKKKIQMIKSQHLQYETHVFEPIQWKKHLDSICCALMTDEIML